MKKINSLIILIVLFIILYFGYRTYINKKTIVDEFKNDGKIFKINPSDYVVITKNKINDKTVYTEEMLKNLGASELLLNKIRAIKSKIKKPIVLGIKKKDDKYRLEIYLYSKEIYDYDFSFVNKNKFKDNLKIILEELGSNYKDNIDNILSNLDVMLISFDIEIKKGTFNNILHLYVKIDDDKDNPKENKELTFDKKFYTMEFNIDTNEISYESYFARLFDYTELKNVLKNLEDIGFDCDIDKLVNDLFEISKKPVSIMFHYKYYNNSIGIYLIGNDYDSLLRFFEKFGYKKLYNNINDIKDLSFDLAVNYDLITCNVLGTAFADFY